MRYSILVGAMMSVAAIAHAQGQQTSAQTTTQTTAQGGQTTVVQTAGQGGARGGRGAQNWTTSYMVGAPLVLEIGMRQYRADNQTGGSAGNSAARGQFESYVWTSTDLCGLSASSTEPTTMPGIGWHVTGEIVNPAAAGADQLTVNVTWQRAWEKGARVQNGASGSRSITLRNGERIELDRVVPAGASPCGATDARLEASVTAQPAYRLLVNRFALATERGGRGYTLGATSGNSSTNVTGAAAGARGRGAMAGAQGQQGQRGQQGQLGQQGQRGQQPQNMTGRAGGRGMGSGSGSGTAPEPTMATAQGRGTAADPTSAGQGRKALQFTIMWRTYDAELWLVHRKPDGTESVQQQTVRFGVGPATGTFTFPPIQVQSSKGVIAIDISGKLQGFVGSGSGDMVISQTPTDPAAAQHISVKIDRRAHTSGPPLLDITGGSSMVVEVPSPSDVLSFEFPALQKSAEDLLKGHQFSLRVRVTPSGR